MQSPKLPLVGGVIYPLHNNLDLLQAVTVIGGPTDKSLQQGSQATYEVHLWLIPSNLGGDNTYWALSAAYDGDFSSIRFISQGQVPNGAIYPIKLLDGYPIRGNVSLSIAIHMAGGGANDDQFPAGAQIYGYAYRVGRGDVFEPERRFIGLASPDGVSSGVPLGIAAASKTVLHRFENNHLDELSLHFQPPGSGNAQVDLYFEDANGNPVVAPGHKVRFQVPGLQAANSVRDPQSVYLINKAVFGNIVYPTLDHISIESDVDLYVDGYFTRH